MTLVTQECWSVQGLVPSAISSGHATGEASGVPGLVSAGDRPLPSPGPQLPSLPSLLTSRWCEAPLAPFQEGKRWTGGGSGERGASQWRKPACFSLARDSDLKPGPDMRAGSTRGRCPWGLPTGESAHPLPGPTCHGLASPFPAPSRA